MRSPTVGSFPDWIQEKPAAFDHFAGIEFDKDGAVCIPARRTDLPSCTPNQKIGLLGIWLGRGVLFHLPDSPSANHILSLSR
jgi:hypothetical protein